ncbi:MAG: hypothetical protein ACQET5_00375 [Halobacteriota archaeon]|uniref:hypothetical protein n=1 Tax=Natronomonas sp. TaxID=2184060 RepID=UPI0039753F37
MWEYIRGKSVVPGIAAESMLLYVGLGFALAAGAANTTVPMGYAAAIVVAMAAGLGVVSIAIGGAVGVLVHDLFYGAAGYWTLIVSAWIVAYAGSIAWLSPESRYPLMSRQRRTARSILSYVFIMVTAGVYATGVTAWLATALDGMPVYIATGRLLPGVAIAVAVGSVMLLAFELLDWTSLVGTDRSKSADRPETDGGALLRVDPTTVTAAGLFAIGAAWLGGITVLDILARDLGLFGSEQQLGEYVVGIVGTDSLLSTVAVAAFAGVYRYGELAVLLSAPIAVLAVWWYTGHRSTWTSIERGRYDE